MTGRDDDRTPEEGEPDEGLETLALGSEKTRVSGPATPRVTGATGRRIGRYRLIEEIGHGGQGYVHLAEDTSLQRHVALKILPHGHMFSSSARLRFEREAAVAGRLDHPGIARVIEFGEEEGVLYIAMEYIRGRTLAELIAETSRVPGEHSISIEASTAGAGGRPASEAQAKTRTGSRTGSADRGAILGAVRFIESAARAMHVAHEAGLVHRDVKPGNLMVREDGSACVLDFGLAQDDSDSGITLTMTGDVMGTPSYMSPEQVQGGRVRLDRRTDVYSLGVCLFEACTLTRPFRGNSQQELFSAIVEREPPQPRGLNPMIPKDLEAIILTAIDKDRNRRYATALAMADDLKRFAALEPVLARPAGSFIKTLRWLQRNPLAATAMLVVFLAVLVSAVVFYVKGQEAEEARARAEIESTRRGLALAAESRERAAKEAALGDYERLADVKRLEAAVTAAEELFPPRPEIVPALEEVREAFEAIASRMPGHRRLLASLRERAEPPTGRGGDGGPRHRFADQTLQFQHDVLAQLVAEFDRASQSDRGLRALVDRRLAEARRIRAATLVEPAELWTASARRVASGGRYGGFRLAPQLGLVPLGPDPDSGLEEFLHWLSHDGPIPARNAEGRIELGEDTGVILVLVPGGAFAMGSQADDPSAPNHDPASQLNERPVNAVTLEPYFISKYEMTQAQWRRAFGRNPARYPAGFREGPMRNAVTALHPVEQVSWNDAMALLPTIDLDLPTEAEWERAARAGASTIWTGTSSFAEIRHFANINGEETVAQGFEVHQEGHLDPFPYHAPVGSFRPNAFGLHDTTGNVWEWCLDGSGFSYALPARERGLRGPPETATARVSRGGSFNNMAFHCRIAFHDSDAPIYRYDSIGIRPARLIR